MIKDESLGLEIAETSREKLIIDTIKETKDNILRKELQLELTKLQLKYLEEQTVN